VTDVAARVARRAYASASPPTRVHVALRWATCPFPAIAEAVPRCGNVLDVGCGHGLFTLYLALQAPARRITGVDIDDDKLSVARAAAHAAGVGDRVSFAHVDASRVFEGQWETIVEVDMLYLLGRERAQTWVHDAADALRPGGRLVVKELDVAPVWKARWSRFQEVLATRVVRITEGEDLELIPRDDVVSAMEHAGLAATSRRLDRGRLHPHYLAVGEHAGR
jgi:cyclopropane fatty-acyl-phospholipid synthase-like methyltransferase